MTEIWKDIVGQEGRYQVSNLGRVKSLFARKERILNPGLIKSGYLTVVLKNRKSNYVHRLVAEAFNPNPDSKREVNHINKNKTDNRSSNLEWVTTRENALHGYGSKYPGVNWEPKRKRWVAFVYINGKTKQLGRFKTPKEANEAYVRALEQFGIKSKYSKAA